MRTQKTVNGVVHNYYYSGDLLLAEEWNNHLMVFLYDANGSPVGIKYRKTDDATGTWSSYWYDKNLQGDVVAIYDDSGTPLVSYTYDAWGNHVVTPYNNGLSIVPIANNPIRYRGYYYDVDLGLYYLQTRYYDSEIGRFISPDIYLGVNGDLVSYNLYAYCSNNPVNCVDPSGRWIDTVFDLFSFGVSLVEVVINPADVWAWAGLAGDMLDLIPFATGLGEGVKGMRVIAKGIDASDDALDTIRFVKATDCVDDFLDGGLDIARTLDKTTDGFTISNKLAGIKIHSSFMNNGTTIKGTRLRADGLNETAKTIYELKPYNRTNLRKGVKQILNYNVKLGGDYKMIIVFY